MQRPFSSPWPHAPEFAVRLKIHCRGAVARSSSSAALSDRHSSRQIPIWKMIHNFGRNSVGKASATFSSSASLDFLVLCSESPTFWASYDRLRRCRALQNEERGLHRTHVLSISTANEILACQRFSTSTGHPAGPGYNPRDSGRLADDKNHDGGNRTKWGLQPATRNRWPKNEAKRAKTIGWRFIFLPNLRHSLLKAPRLKQDCLNYSHLSFKVVGGQTSQNLIGHAMANGDKETKCTHSQSKG